MALVDAFQVRERFFHFEFFRQADGSLVALEVNVRPAGGLTVDMWNYQSDIDMYREWANLIVTGRIDIPAARPTFCAYIGRKDRYRYAHGTDELVARFGGLVRHHQSIDDIFSAAIGNYGFILRSPELADLERAAEVIQQRRQVGRDQADRLLGHQTDVRRTVLVQVSLEGGLEPGPLKLPI